MKIKKSDVYAALKNDYTLFYKAMPKEWKNIFPVVTIDTLEKMGLHFTVKHTGKMDGMLSLSTTCKCNDICKARIDAARRAGEMKDLFSEDPYRTDVMICGFCFSDSQQDYQKNMIPTLKRNMDILNNGIIHRDYIPVINALYFRGEAFGDFASVNAVINFWNIARYNKSVNFTAWTKNPGFFERAIKAGYKKPRNFKLVLSSLFINKPAVVSKALAAIVDAVFTVYTKEFAEKHNVVINCGARACLSCLRCYAGYKTGEIKYINELLK